MIKLEISTHSGDIDIVEVDEYSADSVAEQLNNSEVQAVVFGDNVYSRIDVKNVKPIINESDAE